MTLSTTTGQTPWLVNYSTCTEAILSISIMSDNLSAAQDINVVMRDLKERQQKMFKEVSQATGQSQWRQKSYYDLGVKGPEIEVGDAVHYEDRTNLHAGEIKSLWLPYKAPVYRVAEKLSDVNYKIAADDGSAKIVHYNQLKKLDGPGRVPEEGAEATDDLTVVPEAPSARRSERERKHPVHLGTDARDPDVQQIP